uniref:Uncharacterized protein n=1 Tax=viral metagenome TaxID=1070528 RepID=A0A6H1ZUJ6_9ZZZZ
MAEKCCTCGVVDGHTSACPEKQIAELEAQLAEAREDNRLLRQEAKALLSELEGSDAC